MTAPYLPPLKSVEGVTLREALTYERTVDDGEEVPPPGTTAPTPTPVDLAFHARAGWRRRFVEQPSAEVDYFGNHRPPLPTAGLTHVRLTAGVPVAGASGSYAKLLYSVDGVTFGNPGRAGAEVVLPIDEVSADGDLKSDGIELRAEARADPWFKCVLGGGDGVESPEIARLSAQFYTATTPQYDRLYLRTTGALYVPETAIQQTAGGVTTPQGLGNCTPETGCPPGAAATFLTVTGDLEAPKSLLHAIGAAETVMQGTTDSSHSDWTGWVERFVSPSMPGGQTVPESLVTFAAAGTITSAIPEGGGIGVGLSLIRESDGSIVLTLKKTSSRPGFFIGKRGRLISFLWPETAMPAGDSYRWVLDCALSGEVGCGCSAHFQSFPVNGYYNGSWDGFGHDEDLTGQSIAAYVDVARMRYDSEIA